MRAPVYRGKRGGRQIEEGGQGEGAGWALVIWHRNNGAEMVIMTRHASAGSIMHRGRGC